MEQVERMFGAALRALARAALWDHRDMGEELDDVLRLAQHAGADPDQREYTSYVPRRYAGCVTIGFGAIRE
jgi:hypothetical protein